MELFFSLNTLHEMEAACYSASGRWAPKKCYIFAQSHLHALKNFSFSFSVPPPHQDTTAVSEEGRDIYAREREIKTEPRESKWLKYMLAGPSLSSSAHNSVLQIQHTISKETETNVTFDKEK